MEEGQEPEAPYQVFGARYEEIDKGHRWHDESGKLGF